jgi:hypothetical protein
MDVQVETKRTWADQVAGNIRIFHLCLVSSELSTFHAGSQLVPITAWSQRRTLSLRDDKEFLKVK